MKRGDYVSIKTDGKYNGQDMRWTEPFAGEILIAAGTVLYHFSDKKLTEFREKETCFFDADDGYGHCYTLTIINDIKLPAYGPNEVRINLDTSQKLRYAGRVQYITNYDAKKIYKNGNWDYPVRKLDNRI